MLKTLLNVKKSRCFTMVASKLRTSIYFAMTASNTPANALNHRLLELARSIEVLRCAVPLKSASMANKVFEHSRPAQPVEPPPYRVPAPEPLRQAQPEYLQRHLQVRSVTFVDIARPQISSTAHESDKSSPVNPLTDT